jgi:ArsR family transcriptional regulator
MLGEIAASKDPLSYMRLRQAHNASSATFSHHINKLKMAGLIEIARTGKCASVTLQRDVLRAYVDRPSAIR